MFVCVMLCARDCCRWFEMMLIVWLSVIVVVTVCNHTTATTYHKTRVKNVTVMPGTNTPTRCGAHVPHPLFSPPITRRSYLLDVMRQVSGNSCVLAQCSCCRELILLPFKVLNMLELESPEMKLPLRHTNQLFTTSIVLLIKAGILWNTWVCVIFV